MTKMHQLYERGAGSDEPGGFRRQNERGAYRGEVTAIDPVIVRHPHLPVLLLSIARCRHRSFLIVLSEQDSDPPRFEDRHPRLDVNDQIQHEHFT